MTNLQSLYLYDNQIEIELIDPKTFDQLTNLQRLDLDRNKIGIIDPQINYKSKKGNYYFKLINIIKSIFIEFKSFILFNYYF